MTYHCSASQISTAELCLRKWAFKKLDGLSDLPGAAAALGSAVHKQIELYLRSGQPIDLSSDAGRIAMAGAHLWPTRDEQIVVEHRFEIVLGGVPFVGFIDVLCADRVIDHKTTSDLRWAKTRDDLLSDPQATLYAHATGARKLQWIYYRTKGVARALDVTVNVTDSDIAPRVERTAQTARLLQALSTAEPRPRALDLPATWSACGAFGGCPFRQNCEDATDQERFRSMLTTAEKLAQLQQRVNAPLPQPTPDFLGLEGSVYGAPLTDAPPELAGGATLPEGFFWFRTGSANAPWSAAPESLRAQIDPDGTKAYVAPTPEAIAETEAVIAEAFETGKTFDEVLAAATPKRGRGRPRKAEVEAPDADDPRVVVRHDPTVAAVAAAAAEPPGWTDADLQSVVVTITTPRVLTVPELLSLMQAGVMTVDEARTALGLPL